MRPDITSNPFEISLQEKISLWCQVSLLLALGEVKLTSVQISVWSV